MTKKGKKKGLVVSEWKFLKEIKEYFWVEADYIKAVLKELEDWKVEDITLTEQFNKGYIEWMKSAWEELKKFFEQQWVAPIQDFREIDSKAKVEDKVIEDIVKPDTIIEEEWKL